MANNIKYLTESITDADWGLTVTTAGSQYVLPSEEYPPSKHPASYNFNPAKGRVLNEYQIIYITEGSGYFSSAHYERKRITHGTIIVLFPGEWHSYAPDKATGWKEHWIGFHGKDMDERVKRGFFTVSEPIKKIGVSATIVGLYENVIDFASREKSGYQQIISSIVIHILGLVYYKEKNELFKHNSETIDKINSARILMKNHISETPDTILSPEDIASELNLGYTWFRRKFKEYTGVSPAQYMLQLKIIRAKELLSSTTLPVSEIAYTLGFESVGQFSTFFKKKESISPSVFRERVMPR